MRGREGVRPFVNDRVQGARFLGFLSGKKALQRDVVQHDRGNLGPIVVNDASVCGHAATVGLGGVDDWQARLIRSQAEKNLRCIRGADQASAPRIEICLSDQCATKLR